MGATSRNCTALTQQITDCYWQILCDGNVINEFFLGETRVIDRPPRPGGVPSEMLVCDDKSAVNLDQEDFALLGVTQAALRSIIEVGRAACLLSTGGGPGGPGGGISLIDSEGDFINDGQVTLDSTLQIAQNPAGTGAAEGHIAADRLGVGGLKTALNATALTSITTYHAKGQLGVATSTINANSGIAAQVATTSGAIAANSTNSAQLGGQLQLINGATEAGQVGGLSNVIGANAHRSVTVGGQSSTCNGTNQFIAASNGSTLGAAYTGSAIIGGGSIVPNVVRTDTVYVPNIAIWNTPTTNNTLTQLLVREPGSNGIVRVREASSLIGAAMNNLPEYASDAAAGTGGLAVGSLYKLSTDNIYGLPRGIVKERII